jgi:hypothetical protein
LEHNYSRVGGLLPADIPGRSARLIPYANQIPRRRRHFRRGLDPVCLLRDGGELRFLHQALAQREARHVRAEDGWPYFLHGWTQVIAEVLKVRIDEALFQRLAVVAGAICRPALPTSLGGA